MVKVDTVTFWLVPALATGTEFNLAAVTVKTTTALSTLPSFTVKPSKYVPAKSAVNVALTLDVEDKVAVLPTGLNRKDQR